MSERMTDAEFEIGATRAHITGMWQHTKSLLEEARRARASEEAILAQRDELKAALDASDAQHREALRKIQALADALGGTNGLGHTPSRSLGEARLSCDTCAHFAPTHADHCSTGAALRLAGRLK